MIGPFNNWTALELFEDNFSIGLVTEARAGVKTGLAVNHAEFDKHNWFITFGQFLGPVTIR